MAVPPREPGRLRASRWIGLASVLLLSAGAASVGRAQGTSSDTLHYTQQPVCKIPFQMDPSERRVTEVELFVSRDQGRSWKQYGKALPNQGYFQFTAESDGIY